MEMPWEVCDSHAGSGRKAYTRHLSFEHTGNNEGTMAKSIKVEEADGTIILETNFEIDWEYFGEIDCSFSEDGCKLVITGSDDSREEHNLPSVATV